jgi:hypothetical protein
VILKSKGGGMVIPKCHGGGPGPGDTKGGGGGGHLPR